MVNVLLGEGSRKTLFPSISLHYYYPPRRLFSSPERGLEVRSKVASPNEWRWGEDGNGNSGLLSVPSLETSPDYGSPLKVTGRGTRSQYSSPHSRPLSAWTQAPSDGMRVGRLS